MTTPDKYLQNQNLTNGLLYYPGAGTDYGPLCLFATNTRLSGVVYTDYGIGSEEAERFLAGIPEWNLDHMDKLEPSYIGKETWDEFWPELTRSRLYRNSMSAYCRRSHLSNVSGRSLQLIYLATEAVKTYSIMIESGIVPTAMVLQDHGFDGNWTHFRPGGALHEAAIQLDAFPHLLFVGDNSTPWPGYEQVSDWVVYEGQMHRHARALYKLTDRELARTGYPRQIN